MISFFVYFRLLAILITSLCLSVYANENLGVNTSVVNTPVVNGAPSNLPVLRDPTLPLLGQAVRGVAAETLKLQAIFIRSNGRSAVINGKSVKVGDIFSNYLVTHIAAKSVSLTKDKKNTTLYLRKNLRDVKP